MSEGRGVIYLVWGSQPKLREALSRSIASLALTNPQLSHKVIELPDTGPGIAAYNGLLEKARMLDLSPFRETLYLDTDTVVLGDLSFGFEKARKFGIACCVNECPWAQRFAGIEGETVEYNTGVVFFTRKMKSVFDHWKALARKLQGSVRHVRDGQIIRMPVNDQASFAMAMQETSTNPFVLPLNWNFRPGFQGSFFGPVRIWHDYRDPPPQIFDLAARYGQGGQIIQYHTLADPAER